MWFNACAIHVLEILLCKRSRKQNIAQRHISHQDQHDDDNVDDLHTSGNFPGNPDASSTPSAGDSTVSVTDWFPHIYASLFTCCLTASLLEVIKSPCMVQL